MTWQMSPAGIADQALDGLELDLVAERRRGAVGVDVVDIAGRDAGAAHAPPHATERAIAILGRRRDVVGVAGQAVADQLGVDAGAAALGVIVFFQHHGASALAHHEAVAVAVIGPRRAFGRIVKSGRERPASGKARERDTVDRRLRAAGHHHVGIAQRNQPAGIADGVRAGRAGGDHGVVRALQTHG